LIGVEYSIFFMSKMSCELLLLLLLLGFELSIFWLKRYSSISEFLFNSLVFLNTFLGFSIPLNSRGFVEGSLLNVNTAVVFVVILCLDILRHFLLINNESAGRGSGSALLAIKEVWDRGFGVGNVIWILSCLGIGVFSSKLNMSFISFCLMSPC
jgi:hypothetical protein